MSIFYLSNADLVAGVLESLTESAPSAVDAAQGWTVGKKGASEKAEYRPDLWQPNASFISSAPSAFTGYGYRIANLLSGEFSAGNWVLAFKVKCNSYYAQQGKVSIRLWKGTDANGSNAVLLTSGWVDQSGTIVFTAANQDQTGSVTAALGAVTFAAEYLFLEVLWTCTLSGGNNSATVAWVHNEGAAESLSTPAFTPPGTINLTGNGIPSAEAFGLLFSAPPGVFVPLNQNQGAQDWRDLAINHNTGDVYATIHAWNIFKQTAGGGDFVNLNLADGYWEGLAVNQATGDVYACAAFPDDIYKQTAGIGAFVALGQTHRYWKDVAVNQSTGDVYACVDGGDIYKQTAGAGAFVALGQTTRYWTALAVNPVNGDVYATDGMQVYKQAAGSGDFLTLNQARGGRGLAINYITGDVYLTSLTDADIYRQTAGVGDFVALGQGARQWEGIDVNPLTGEAYATVSSGGDIYKAIGLPSDPPPQQEISFDGLGIPTAEAVSSPTVAVTIQAQLAAASSWPWSEPSPSYAEGTIAQLAAPGSWPWSTLVPAYQQSEPVTGLAHWPWSCPAPTFSWHIKPSRPKQEIHICVLTGGHVGLPDIELPVSSWQARLRDSDPTYVSCVVPNAIAYTDAIIARTGGQLKIYKGYKFIDQAAGRFLALVVETTLNSIRHDTGPRSSSITLVGYANITNATPKTMTYEALTYRALQADGRRRWRTGLKLNISETMAGDTWNFIARPGDTVIYQGESMVIGFISLAVSDTFELVELVEA